MFSFKKFRKKNKLGKSYERGSNIFLQGGKGNSLFFIQEGCVALVLTTPSRKVRLALVKKGGIIGIPHLFGRETRYCTAIATQDTSVIRIDNKLLLARMHSDPSFMYRISSMLNDRLMAIVDRCPCECDDLGECTH